MKRVRSSVAAIVVASTMLLSACASSDSSVISSGADASDATPGPTSTQVGSTVAMVVDGEVNVEAMQSEVDRFIALAPADQEPRLAEMDGRMERELWTLSGLEAALGGPAAADAAFASQSQAIVARAREIGGQPIAISGLRRKATAPSAPNIGEGLFGGIVIVNLGADAIVSSSNDFKDGQTASGELAKGTTISESREHVEMNVDATEESSGVTTRLRIKVEVNPCPDATGRFNGKAKVDVSATKTGGSTGQNGTIDVTISGQIDDDANLASSDMDYRMEWSDFAGGKGSYVDVSGSMGDTKVVGATLNRSGGTPSASLQRDASSVGMLYAYMAKAKVVEAAAKGWQSGRCVTLQPTAAPGPTGLSPSSASTISAAPRSRVDGAAVGGTVTATLSAGEAAVDPAGSKVPADATFTYTAPGEVDKTGSVSLEARSKRGVAKASIDLDTKQKSYIASGGTEVIYSGTIPDLAQPFTINGAGQGFDVVYTYTPSSETAGAMSYEGSGSGITLKGSGTYTISGADPDPLSLTATAHGCVNVGGCRDTTDVITLTRASG